MAAGPIEGPRNILPSPHPDWDFNYLLEEFYAQINDNDLSRVLKLFKGTVPENVNTLEALFDALRRPPERLTSDNIKYLHKIAFFTNNDDLYYKTIKYVDEKIPHSLHCVREHISLDQEEYQDIDQAKFISELQDKLSNRQSKIKCMKKEILRLQHSKVAAPSYQPATPPYDETNTDKKEAKRKSEHEDELVI